MADASRAEDPAAPGERWERAPGLAVTSAGSTPDGPAGDLPSRFAVLDPARPEQAPIILEDAAAAIWALLADRPLATDLLASLEELGIPLEHADAFLESLEAAGLARRTS